ncbi:MAG: prepilin-type N-terminal cleavage/methylation domain-containing protein [Vicinamibacterales bacterium]
MSHSRSSTGFTLIEVLVALASVSVLLAGAAGLLSIASMAIRSSRLSTTATLLALQKAEQLGAVRGTLTSGTTQDYFAADGSPTAAASATLVRRWTITSAWAASGNVSVIVEVFASGAGRIADMQVVVGGEGGAEP